VSLRLTMTALACALLCAAPARAETVALQGTVTSAPEGAMEGVLVSAKRAGSTITVDDARGEFWIGANHSAELLKVEPLD